MLNTETQKPTQPGSWHDTLQPGTRVPYPIDLEKAKFYARAGSISAISNYLVADIIGAQLDMSLQVRNITVKLIEVFNLLSTAYLARIFPMLGNTQLIKIIPLMSRDTLSRVIPSLSDETLGHMLSKTDTIQLVRCLTNSEQ